MRGRRRTLGARLATAQGEGGDASAGQLCSREQCAQRGHPCPAGAPPQRSVPVASVDAKSQEAALPMDLERDPREAALVLHGGHSVLLPWKEPAVRDSTAAAALSKAVGVSLAPVGGSPTGLASGSRETVQRDWPGREPGTVDGPQGQCPRGQPWVSGQPGHPKLGDRRIFQGEPPRAFPAVPGSTVEPPCLCSTLPGTPHTSPEVPPEDETRYALLGHLTPRFSQQIIGYENMLPGLESVADDLWLTWVLSAV